LRCRTPKRLSAAQAAAGSNIFPASGATPARRAGL
jgi:hypothetical protein